MKYTIFLLLSLLLFACTQSKVIEKEIVYENYSLEQLKEYLSGKWLDTTQKQADPKHPYYWQFQFSGSDHGRFQDIKIDGDKTYMPTDAPSFAIYNEDKSWWISFHSFFSTGKSTGQRIIKISNRRLVLSSGNTTETYLKIP